MKVILDCNIWISLLIGHQKQLIRRILTDQRFDVYVCEQLINEIKDVASRDKIRKYVSGDDVRQLMRIIYSFCQFVSLEVEVAPSAIRDPKDLYLLSLAESIEANYIVSGDTDLTDLRCYNKTSIIKLAEFKTVMMYG